MQAAEAKAESFRGIATKAKSRHLPIIAPEYSQAVSHEHPAPIGTVVPTLENHVHVMHPSQLRLRPGPHKITLPQFLVDNAYFSVVRVVHVARPLRLSLFDCSPCAMPVVGPFPSSEVALRKDLHSLR